MSRVPADRSADLRRAADRWTARAAVETQMAKQADARGDEAGAREHRALAFSYADLAKVKQREADAVDRYAAEASR